MSKKSLFQTRERLCCSYPLYTSYTGILSLAQLKDLIKSGLQM